MPMSFKVHDQEGGTPIIEWPGCGCRAASKVEAECLARIAELEAALKPFASAVRSDNHDITIDTSRIERGHYMQAKRLLKG